MEMKLNTVDLANVKLINLTPHDITLELTEKLEGLPTYRQLPIGVSGYVARVDVTQQLDSSIAIGNGQDIPVYRQVTGDVVIISDGEIKGDERVFGLNDLPIDSNVLYIVSAMVRTAAVNRPDFISPDTSKGAVRDGDGKIIAVRGFIK